jgi:multicomponent K+:H+ antiporter subunit D
MGHWIVVPIVLPAIMAALIVLALRRRTELERTFSIAATAALVAVAVGLAIAAGSGPPEHYALGSWPPPFGIVLVLDRLSALMVLLTSALALAVLVYAAAGWDRRGRHFHALFQFQLMGLNGAFLTGDIFNLFVFFEVLLIASYGLMLHGAGTPRIRAGTHYVVVNLTGSTVFLIAVGLIYGVTGTLNMADLAVKVPQVAAGDRALLHAGALLLLVVFGIKAALVPLHFWLPGTYSATSPPVAALFAIMTKVGAYSILRIYTLVFGEGAGDSAWIAKPWLVPAALVTLALGMIGALAARSLRWLVCFALIASIGTLMAGFGVFTEKATAAALYYMVHSTLIAAALFLLADQIARGRDKLGDTLELGPAMARAGLLSALFLAGAMAMVGLPPLSGFVGKLLILDGVRGLDSAPWIWSVVLATTLLATVAFARAGSLLFWKSTAVPAPARPADAEPAAVLPLAATALLIGATFALSLFAAPVVGYLEATARQLFDPAEYIRAVLGADYRAAR